MAHPFVDLTNGAFENATEVSLNLPEDLPVEEWQAIGRRIQRVQKTALWWIGDWWIHAERYYGERKALVEADSWTGPSYQACVDAGTVCRAFAEITRRRVVLAFSHHREVAALDRADADRLLDQAVVNNWSVRRLRGEVQRQANAAEAKKRRERFNNPPSSPLRPPTPFVVRGLEVLRPKLWQKPKPEIRLDDSGVTAPVPEELAALDLEPPAMLDRIAIAKAALAQLDPDEFLIAIDEAIAERDAVEQHAIRATLRPLFSE